VATDFELAVMKELSEIKSLATKAASSTESLDERLFNGGSGVINTLQAHIQEVKEDRLRDEKWERLHNILHYSTGPLLITLHQIARKLGITV